MASRRESLAPSFHHCIDVGQGLGNPPCTHHFLCTLVCHPPSTFRPPNSEFCGSSDARQGAGVGAAVPFPRRGFQRGWYPFFCLCEYVLFLVVGASFGRVMCQRKKRHLAVNGWHMSSSSGCGNFVGLYFFLAKPAEVGAEEGVRPSLPHQLEVTDSFEGQMYTERRAVMARDRSRIALKSTSLNRHFRVSAKGMHAASTESGYRSSRAPSS